MIYFTIITCTYDASKYIDRTLASVQEQSYPHIEHFIIDGVSKDDTVKKAQTYAYDSLFLNAGDVFHEEDTLTCIAEQLKGKPLPGVIYGDTDIVDNKGNFIRKRRLAPPEKLSWKSFKQGMLVCHQSFYARTDIAKQVPYNLHYRYSADVDWCIRIMKEAEKQGLVLWNTHKTLCSYLEGGMTEKSHRASLKERFMVMSDHYGTLTTIIQHLWFVVRAIIKR